MADLSNISDSNGFIRIAALDHRDSLKKVLSEDQIPPFKTLCTEIFAPFSTAVLIDPEYGSEGIRIARNMMIGILLSREISGYTDTPHGRKTELYRDFDSLKLRDMGASAIKVVLYYNSEAKNADEQKRVAEHVRKETVDAGLPFLLEIVTYPVEGSYYHKGDAILRSINDLRQFADILKLEYPLDEVDEDNVDQAVPYLDQITSSAEIPWIMLSRGMDYDLYKKALKIAKEEGCSGYAVGRAVWQEAPVLETWSEKENFIRTTAKNRMEALSKIFS